MDKQLQAIIESRSIPVPECGCWLWTASRAKTGYGDFRLGRHYLAHRASYEAFVGAIPDGMHVLHKCDVRSCVNPAHLFVGTNKDNIDDSVKKGRRKGITRKRPSGLVYKKQTLETKERRRVTTPEQRQEVMRLSKSGLSQRVISEMLGIGQHVVFKIRHGHYE